MLNEDYLIDLFWRKEMERDSNFIEELARVRRHVPSSKKFGYATLISTATSWNHSYPNGYGTIPSRMKKEWRRSHTSSRELSRLYEAINEDGKQQITERTMKEFFKLMPPEEFTFTYLLLKQKG